jgi:hypothetical protein
MRATHRTSWIVAGFAGLAALLGFLLPDVYPKDSGTEAMLRGYDLVTLVLIAPGLAATLVAQRRPGPRVAAVLVEVSLLSYLAYTYAYYVLGTGFTDLMLLHAAVFSTALVGLVLAMSRLDTNEVAAAFGPHTHVRPAAVILAVLAASLATMWIGWSVHSAVTGEIPPGSALLESDVVVHLGVVLDLTLLVPLYAFAAVLLWRRAPWGYVLAVVALVSGLLHQVSYVVATFAQYVADVPGVVAFDPVEPVIVTLYGVAAATLLLGLRRPRHAPSSAPPPGVGTPDPTRRSHAHTH